MQKNFRLYKIPIVIGIMGVGKGGGLGVKTPTKLKIK